MANICPFEKSGQAYHDEIVPLGFQNKGVRIVPEIDRTNDARFAEW